LPDKGAFLGTGAQNRTGQNDPDTVDLPLRILAQYIVFAEADYTPIDSVAVLPFVNASGNPDSEYLSDGITESLINSLSQLPHLKSNPSIRYF
jgi:hypothetical protein